MVEVGSCRRHVAAFVFIFLLTPATLSYASTNKTNTLLISIPGTAIFLPPFKDGDTCKASQAMSTGTYSSKEFENSVAKHIEGIQSKHVTVRVNDIQCDKTLQLTFDIKIPPGEGQNDTATTATVRDFRDDPSHREYLWLDLQKAGFDGSRVDVTLTMLKCTPSLKCSSLTGTNGNFVEFPLGFNVTTVPPLMDPPSDPLPICEFQEIWLAEDLRKQVNCTIQTAIIFGGIAAAAICCPLLCYICRERRRKYLEKICSAMDADFLGTGNEANHKYYWTSAAAADEDLLAGLDELRQQPEENTKLKQSQMNALIKHWDIHTAEGSGAEADMEDGHFKKDLLDHLLKRLMEQKYITEVDPSKTSDVLEDNNTMRIRAASLQERAVVQKGAQCWQSSFLSGWGIPSYEDGTEVEFYSIRNVCWVIATLRVFVYDPDDAARENDVHVSQGNPACTSRAANTARENTVTERQIVYGLELQTSTENAAPSWRYNIGLEQLRLPMVRGELVEAFHAESGRWLLAKVDGPRTEYRIGIGHGVFRQQLGYNLRILETDQVLKLVPAERVRRRFDVDAPVKFYHSPQNGWITAKVKEDIEPEQDSEANAASLQPWNALPGGRRSAGNQRIVLSEKDQKKFHNHGSEWKASHKPDSWTIALRHVAAGAVHNSNCTTDITEKEGAENPLIQAEGSRVNIWTFARIVVDGDDNPSSIGRVVPSYMLRPHPDSTQRRETWL